MVRTPWLKTPHWSTDIPFESAHARLPILAERGFVQLRDLDPPIPDDEFLDLEYFEYKSGGDTNWAPIATRDGSLEMANFWTPTDERPDRDFSFCPNASKAPTIQRYVEAVGANFGRVRITCLQPQNYDETLRHIHRDDNNRFNSESSGWIVRSWLELSDTEGSYMILMEQGDDGLPDPSTEERIPLHRGAQFVIDTQRLWHVVNHNRSEPRYALISSFESGPALQSWIESQLP
jgi:hypothetical protein